MIINIISFILRILLIVSLWAFAWHLIKPKTQLMRIIRAAVLLIGLLGILFLLRSSGQ